MLLGFEGERGWNFLEQNWLNRWKMVQFECHGHSYPPVLSILAAFPLFSSFSLSQSWDIVPSCPYLIEKYWKFKTIFVLNYSCLVTLVPRYLRRQLMSVVLYWRTVLMQVWEILNSLKVSSSPPLHLFLKKVMLPVCKITDPSAFFLLYLKYSRKS